MYLDQNQGERLDVLDLTGADRYVGSLVGSNCQTWGRPNFWPRITTTDFQSVLQCLSSGQVKQIPDNGVYHSAELMEKCSTICLEYFT